MPTHNQIHFAEAELPQPDRERLLAMLFGGTAASTDSPAVPYAVGHAGAGEGEFLAALTHAEPGAGQVRSAGGALRPPAPACPGSATNEAVA